MAFNVSYIYDIKNRYSSKLKAIAKDTERFEKIVARAKQKTARLSGTLNTASTRARNFGINLDAASDKAIKSIEKLNKLVSKTQQNFTKLNQKVRAFDTAAEAIDRASHKMTKFALKAKIAGKQIKDVGDNLMSKLTLPLTAVGIASGITSVKMEDAFTGVKKTVVATKQQFAKLRQGFEELSTRIPVAVTGLFKIGESAGQLGIETENILSFSKVIADLGATTNLVGEEGATQLARFANIVQMNQGQFERLGSTIVHLGNNMATTEAEIVGMGLRLAGAGNIVGMTESNIMSMAATLTSLGINAEAGGTAFSRVMLKINDAVMSGGKMLNRFAKISGTSSKKFAETFRKDASTGLLSFVEGLARLKKEGKNVNAILAAVEFNEIRVRDALLRASGSGDLFRRSLSLGNKAWEENNALLREAELRYGTSGSKLKMLWNRLKLISKEVGDVIIPVFLSLSTKVMPILERFKALSKRSKILAISLAALAAALPPILIFLGFMVTSFSALIPLLTGAVSITGVLSGALAGLGTVVGILTSPISIIIGAIGYLAYKLATTKELIGPLMQEFRSLGAVIFQEGKEVFKFFGFMTEGETKLQVLKRALIGFTAVISFVIKMIKALVRTLGLLFTNLTTIPKIIKAAFTGNFSDIGKIIKETFSKNKVFLKDLQSVSQSGVEKYYSSLVPKADTFLRGHELALEKSWSRAQKLNLPEAMKEERQKLDSIFAQNWSRQDNITAFPGAKSRNALGGDIPINRRPRPIEVNQTGEINGEITVRAANGSEIESARMEDNRGANVRFAALGG